MPIVLGPIAGVAGGTVLLRFSVYLVTSTMTMTLALCFWIGRGVA